VLSVLLFNDFSIHVTFTKCTTAEIGSKFRKLIFCVLVSSVCVKESKQREHLYGLPGLVSGKSACAWLE